MRRLFILLLLSLACAFSRAADMEHQFVTVELAHGASVGIPQTWDITPGEELQTPPADMAAAADQHGYAELFARIERLVAASSPDPDHYAGVSIISIAVPDMTPSWPASLTKAKLKAIEDTIRQDTEAIRSRFDEKVSGWSPLKKTVIGRNTVLHISLMCSSADAEHKEHVIRFYGNGRVYDIYFWTHPEDESANLAVLDKIAESFIAP